MPDAMGSGVLHAMNWPKSGKPGGRDEPIEDPQLLADALQALLGSGMEFSIKVEGTSTLPYASVLQSLVPESREVILKLMRPLPHELISGAAFRAVFAVEEQRYEALMSYVGREGYLQYRFSQPEHLFYADRRRQRRFPFRPRENAYVIASDGGIPGLGVAGPLVNISLGGVCMRVDRVLKLDDGVRIPVNTALFGRGSSFPRIRIQDLPRAPLIELSGRVTHTSERGTEVLLGFDFGELTGEGARTLSESLAFREKLLQARGGGSVSEFPGGTRPDTGSHTRVADKTTEESSQGPASQGFPASADPLLLLRRKTASLLVIGRDSTLMARCREWLWQGGYHRIEMVPDPEAAVQGWEGRMAYRPRLVCADISLQGEGQEPLAAVLALEKRLEGITGAPTAILCEDLDPMLMFRQSESTRMMPCHGDAERWLAALDDLVGIGPGSA